MKERLVIAGALAGVAALVAVIIVVFQFGRIDPSPPSLEDEPNRAIPGEILFQSDEACLTRAYASGDARQEICLPSVLYIEPFAWTEPDAIEIWDRGELVRFDLVLGGIEPVPGVNPSQQRYPERPPVSVKGETAMGDEGDLVIINDDARETVASFDIGQRWIQPILWSPDGAWIIVEWYRPDDDGSELWIVSRDGSVTGTIATGVNSTWVAWRIEGTGATPERSEIVSGSP